MPGVEGALAVVVMPRYVLHNSLGVRLQYRQQGTLDDRELMAGGAQPLRWADSALPKRLCLRLQEAGWLWSGGMALDSPGDLFVKIRHRWACQDPMKIWAMPRAMAGLLHMPTGPDKGQLAGK
jgi:hypothetical protein